MARRIKEKITLGGKEFEFETPTMLALDKLIQPLNDYWRDGGLLGPGGSTRALDIVHLALGGERASYDALPADFSGLDEAIVQIARICGFRMVAPGEAKAAQAAA